MVQVVPVVPGERADVESPDGTSIATVTDGQGPPLLLVHGGMVSSTRWLPLWPLLTPHVRVTAMDRRGRGRSGDGPYYSLQAEADDVAAVTRSLAAASDEPVAVFGHSYGASCALVAVADGAPVDRLALYEPPGPEAVPSAWRQEVGAMLRDGQVGRAVVGFLVDVVGFAPEQVAALRDSPAAEDSLTVAARTMAREAEAIATTDLGPPAARVTAPVLLLLGTRSPAWAGSVTHRLADALPDATVADLPGSGHEAVDAAPGQVADELLRFVLGAPREG